MALENALIAKIVGSITVLEGAGGGGIVYKKEISDFVSSLFKKEEVVKEPKTVQTISGDYLVVAQQVEAGSSDVSTEDLYENSTKKFKCQKDEKTIDETCEIYSLTVDTAKKLLNLKKTDTNTNVTGKLVKDTYYKLKVDSSKFVSITYDGSYLIELKSNSTGDTKSFGKLKVLAKINDESLTTDNKLIIAKVQSNNLVDETIDNYQCQIGATQQHTLDCEIYKFTSDLKNLSSLSFSVSPTKVEKTLKNDIKVESYCIIDFTKATTNKEKLNLENLKNTIVFVKTGDSSDVSKKAEFIDAKSFVGKFKETEASNNQVFISFTETAE